MATCKDCLGYEFCSRSRGGQTNFYGKETACNNVEYLCPDFKDKSRFVEVVRCKDCVNFKSTSNPKYCTKHIDDWGNGEIYTDEDDFCSFGERRSDDG